jgi:toxin YoeB
VRVHFTDLAWEEYLYCRHHEPEAFMRINDLIEDARKTPFKGLGKPEPLKYSLAGCWSRRVTKQHRLVYAVEGSGAEQRITVVQCRYHY